MAPPSDDPKDDSDGPAGHLVTIEARIKTNEDAHALGDRIRESIALIAGRDSLEEFRVKSMPLAPPKKPH